MTRLQLVAVPVALGVLGFWGATTTSAAEFEVGGPLEGPPLTLFPTQQGEKPGYPGCIPGLAATVQPVASGDAPPPEWDPQEQYPQYQVYPGSIENWRAYWLKYVPVRSMFDRASLLKNWIAPKLPGAENAKIEQYAAPIYWVPRHSTPKATGKFNPPVPVVRAGVKTPVFDLDLGDLPIGVYAVRVIGAVETANIGQYRKPLYLAMTVNDGKGGEESFYRQRVGFQDEFYSITEFYINAPAPRHYRAKLWVDEGSTVELLVHNIDLHDALAGSTRRAIKQKSTLTTPDQVAQVRGNKDKSPNVKLAIDDLDKRYAFDDVIWRSLPPLNVQLGGTYGLNHGYANSVQLGANGKTADEIAAEFGAWTVPRYRGLSAELITNEKLKLTYSVDDLAARKPLPDPYPIKDTGNGVVTPAQDGRKQQELAIIADAVAMRFNRFNIELEQNANRYYETGDKEAGWTAALQLCRMAWQYPSLDGTLSLSSVVSDPGGFERDSHFRRRDPSLPVGTGNGFSYQAYAKIYDRVFDIIKGDPAFAKSLNRFVPWVKTPEDAVQLVDVYLIQNLAKRMLRYNFLYDNEPTMVADMAAVLGDRTVTDPWLAWIFSKAYIYPNPPAGLGEAITTGNSREGTGYIGSWMYSNGEQASSAGEALDGYLHAGGNPAYDVTNPRLYPKVSESAYWTSFRTRLAGLQFPRVGDVGGPDKEYGYQFTSTLPIARSGWEWTHDPAFAFIIKHYIGRKQESDADWAAIETAAAKQSRAPWLENRSRVLSSWFGALESGTQYDDFRFRRAVMLRIGQGYGHAHGDTLDLQLMAHGLPMTIDGGQRPGYNKPGDATTRLHNLVEVDGKDWQGHAWVRSLSDADGARYLQAEAVPPADRPNVKSYRRQVALIDVDDGAGAKTLTPAQLLPNAVLDKDVVTPNSYVFDVVRVAGGKTHTYCFHGALEDELVTNLADPQPYEKLSPASQEYVGIFRNEPIKGYPMEPQRYGGKMGEVFEATWRTATEVPGVGLGEKEMAQGIFNPAGPRKYTRLHLLGQGGGEALTGWSWCRQWNYGYNIIMAQRRSEAEAEVVFPALIEPYAGKPFIAERRLLEVMGNDTDAARAVAVEVKTTNGRTDWLFSDGRPEKARRVGDTTVSGEFGYISRDANGLRQAALTGGTDLSAADVKLHLAERERTAKIASVDYAGRSFTIDRPWTVGVKGSAAEVGVPGRMTTYMLTGAAAAGAGKSTLSTEGGADFFLSRIVAVDPATRIVSCALGMPHQAGAVVPGIDKQLVASNADGTKFWRATYLGKQGDGKQHGFQLDAPVKADDFNGGGFRLWEYGLGDTVRQPTSASLRRTAAGLFEVQANSDLTLTLPGTTIEMSADGKAWKLLVRNKAGKLATCKLPAATFANGAVQLRVS